MLNRRDVLKGLSLPILSTLPNINFAANKTKSNKAIILIWLGGGHASQETFAPTLDGPDVSRSTTGTIETNIEGIYLGGTFSNLAKLADSYTLIHGLSHNDFNHSSASHWNMTGYMTTASDKSPSKNPSYGSIISSYFGSNSKINGIPHYVKASSIEHDGPTYMGIINDGFNSNEEGIRNLTLNATKDSFERRLDFIKVIESSNKLEKNQLIGGWTDLRNQAVKVITGSAAEAFKIEKESSETQLLYGVGKSNLGQQLLLARRLIESGSKCINVNFPGWDNHSNIKQAMERIGTELDIYLSVLIRDLKSRGMEKDVMIVVSSEFSRTSINRDAGRDHLATAQSSLIFGGNFNHGKIIGEMTKDRIAPSSKAIHPLEIVATILKHFSIPNTYTFIDNTKRPRHIIEGSYNSLL